MIQSARRTAGAHEVSSVVQHRRADESTGLEEQLRIMLIPPAQTLAIFPIENIKSSNASQSVASCTDILVSPLIVSCRSGETIEPNEARNPHETHQINSIID
jgi:hypothetical protein